MLFLEAKNQDPPAAYRVVGHKNSSIKVFFFQSKREITTLEKKRRREDYTKYAHKPTLEALSDLINKEWYFVKKK